MAISAIAAGAAGVMVLASPAVASTVNHTRSGSPTVNGLTVYYTFGCLNVTTIRDSNGQPEAAYNPMWNFKVVEHGQTAWKYVRFGYLERWSEETWYFNVPNNSWDLESPAWRQVHNIGPANSVWDPAKVVGPVTSDDEPEINNGVLSDDGAAIGMQFDASTDGTHWKPLVGAYGWNGGTLNKPGMFYCDYRPYP